FFFQAEDGIRDFHVTGVQTCALPIWPQATVQVQNTRFTRAVAAPYQAKREEEPVAGTTPATWSVRTSIDVTHVLRCDLPGILLEIGRASCRERGENSVVAVCVVTQNA